MVDALERKPTLSRNIVYSIIGQLGLAILAIATVHVIFSRMTNEEFGVVMVSMLWGSILVSAMDLGISTAIVQHLSSKLTRKDSVVDLLRLMSLIYWSLAIVIIAFFFATGNYLIPLFEHFSGSNSDADIKAAMLIIAGSGLTMPRVMYAATLRGCEKFGLITALDLSLKLTQQLGLIITTIVTGSIYDIAVWVLGSYLLSTSVYAVAVARTFSAKSLIPAYNRTTVSEVKTLSNSLILISISSLVHVQGDQAVVSAELPLSQAGFYSSISQLASRGQALFSSLADASLPALTRQYTAGGIDLLRKEYKKVFSVIGFGAIFVYGSIALLAGPILQLVFSKAVESKFAIPLVLILGGYTLNALLSPIYLACLARGIVKRFAWRNVLVVTLTVVAVVFLTKRFGVLGASYSWLIAGVLGILITLPKMCEDGLGQRTVDWFILNSKLLPSLLCYMGLLICIHAVHNIQFAYILLITFLMGITHLSIWVWVERDNYELNFIKTFRRNNTLKHVDGKFK